MAAMGDEPSLEGSASASRSLGPALGAIPWSRALLLLAVAGPALWLGGVKPWVVPSFALVVFGLLLRRCLRSDEPLRVPGFWWLGLLAAAVTLLQWLPLPPGLLDLLAPGLREAVAELTADTGLGTWNRLSIHPGQTGLEFARVLALTGLFIAAAQLGWRLVAGYVALTGTCVTVIGLIHKLGGATAIYGIYAPRQPMSGLGQKLGTALLTSFVNPNHQSGLLLIGVFAAAAMAVDLSARASAAPHHAAGSRLADRAYLAWGAVAIQATGLALSMSRAALIAALLVTPLALVLSLGKARALGPPDDQRRRSRRRLGLIAVVVGMSVLAATHGAWDQLATLRDPESFRAKVRIAVEGLDLLRLSPVLGIGRGTFVDLFPLVDREPGPIAFTHLECTPIAWVVEWGVAGAIVLLGSGLWWWRSFRGSASGPRRLALCGLLALAIQSGADFSLDYLGVTAPAVALAGALGIASARRSGTKRTWSPRRTWVVALVGLLAAEGVALASIPGSWSLRRARDLELLAASLEPSRSAEVERAAEDALRHTPLDPFLHLALARAHAQAGRWEVARTRAEVAARLRPASLDAHLLAAVAAAELGAPLGAHLHVQRGLEALREPVAPALIPWLLAEYPEPEQLVAVAPQHDQAWAALAQAVARSSPAHARALASARSRTHPDDPEPLRIQAELALAARNPGLALHHARLLAELQPERARVHKLRADARFAHATPEHLRAAVAELELARQHSRLDDPAAVDELLVTALVRLGDPASFARAEQLIDGLLARRAKPEARRRREALAEQIRSARGGAPP
jgi:tetratricopeptide (TPR) repeat protein